MRHFDEGGREGGREEGREGRREGEGEEIPKSALDCSLTFSRNSPIISSLL